MTKILWGGKHNNKAVGVVYLHNGKERELRCNKGVVLSGGTRTPLILQQSGVGYSAQLLKLDIPVVSDITNVGSQLANHLIVSCLFSKSASDLPSTDINALYSSGAFLPDPITVDLTGPRSSE